MTQGISRRAGADLWRCAFGIVMAITMTIAFSSVCAAGAEKSAQGPEHSQAAVMQALHAADVAIAALDAPGQQSDPPGLSGPPGQSGGEHGQGYLHRTEPRSKARGKAWGPGGKKKKNKKFRGDVESSADLGEIMSISADQPVEGSAIPEPGSLIALSTGVLGLAGIIARRRR